MSDFLLEFPDEESQTREIYAQFGLAAYTASVFEEGLAIEGTMLALVDEVRKRAIKTEAEWQKRHDEQMARAHALTLGGALSRLGKLMKMPDDLQKLFEDAREKRNYLLHHFFRTEIHEFYTAGGRLRMHDKLLTYVDLFLRADQQLMNATSELRQKIGLSDEKLRKSLEQLEAAYRSS